MSFASVQEYLRQFGLGDRAMAFDVSSATVQLAAEAVGCEPCRIAKTLSFLVNGAAVLIVAAGDAKIDNPKYKAQFHTKAVMLTPEQLETLVGHGPGGVCPFDLKEGCAVYLDQSLKRFDTVFPACGTASSAVRLTVDELETCARPVAWIDVCKGWQEA